MTIKEIKNGETTLITETDYTVYTNGNITFDADYLDTPKADSYTLTITYKPFGVDVAEDIANTPKATNIIF